MRHVVYISGTRADYGLMKRTLRAIDSDPRLKLTIIATGMHIMPEFGETVTEIKKDGFEIIKLEARYLKGDKESMSSFAGQCIKGLTDELGKIKPDIILLLGDRAEMIAGAAVGTYLGIPVAHIHGGDVSSTVDDPIRHAITKLAHIHFPATKESAERIIKMGESEERVHVVGAPGLDSIVNLKLSKESLAERFNLDMDKPFFLVLQHPVSQEIDDSESQMSKTMAAVESFNTPAIVVYPNADAGSRQMIEVIEKKRQNPLIIIYRNINHQEFIGLMKHAAVMIGNSSSGIIESSSFRLPVINIGSRQKGRQRANNVLNVGYETEEIRNAIEKALHDPEYRKRLKECDNPYGDGNASEMITKIISELKIDAQLLRKTITY